MCGIRAQMEGVCAFACMCVSSLFSFLSYQLATFVGLALAQYFTYVFSCVLVCFAELVSCRKIGCQQSVFYLYFLIVCWGTFKVVACEHWLCLLCIVCLVFIVKVSVRRFVFFSFLLAISILASLSVPLILNCVMIRWIALFCIHTIALFSIFCSACRV